MASAIGLQGFQKWFKTDKVTIDNWLFRLHHQVSFAILMVGLIFIFVENHMNGKAVTCRGGDDYSNKFCWIHGTGYVAPALQGEVTNCMVDQTGLDEGEHTTTITYYIWLPFLLVCLMGLSKLSRTLWKNLEGGLIESLITSEDSEKIGEVILEKSNKRKYRLYHIKFFLCELLNVAAVVLIMWICDQLFNGKFWSYGSKVIEFMKLDPTTVEELIIPDPKCNLFPTEVSCQVITGAITGTPEEKNLLCILSNNIFNQHYFFFIWIWWMVLFTISGICLVCRVARMVIPDFSKRIFQFKHGNLQIVVNIDRLGLSGEEFFILDRVADNIELVKLEQLLQNIEERKGHSSLMSQVNPSAMENGRNRDTDKLYSDEPNKN